MRIFEIDDLAPIVSSIDIADGTANGAAEMGANVTPIPIGQILQRNGTAVAAEFSFAPRGEICSSDAQHDGYSTVRNYLDVPYEGNAVDWVITNPPFRLAEDFVHRSLIVARRGVAVLVRTVFIESVGRYRNLFAKKAPTICAQYTERVPMVRGRLDRKASTATGYAWLVWQKPLTASTRLVWVPPSRKGLERDTDYPR
jgi:hypothetical protein